ncbi:hypothetical protein SAMN05444320_104115 [Streptoalloteichus hindustanus]|uniref:Uncharacterized protein n=1 Tax=Streptoalloteichus hindustanus TaxID=2017 RepID=A0A1M5CPR9_STRHI|nr:hypothetical protein SAMN05444320_104115 [Streptoalloteichus hindustanus]
MAKPGSRAKGRRRCALRGTSGTRQPASLNSTGEAWLLFIAPDRTLTAPPAPRGFDPSRFTVLRFHDLDPTWQWMGLRNHERALG